MLKKILACGLAALSLSASFAQATEAEIRSAVSATYGPQIKIEAVRKLDMLGLYEVQIGNEVLYSDAKGTYFIQGDILDTKAKKNLSEARRAKLSQIKFSDLPLDLAVKTVRGNGKRVFATFEDPNCGYCKKLGKDIASMTDITMYTFMYPILSADSMDKSKAIWCAGDRSKAWNDWIVNGAVPAAGNCDAPIDKVVALGRKLSVRGTPLIVLSSGERIGGAVPAAQLEQELNRVAAGIAK